MNVSKITQEFLHMQNIFRVAAFLQLTTHFWPHSHTVKNGAVYDFIVVGGGTAGCVIASRLVEIKNVTVLLIEAGGSPPWEASIPKHFPYLKNTVVDWNMTTASEPSLRYHRGKCAEIPQGKMLGGTSSLNYMMYERGNPVEYATWASIVNSTSWVYDEVNRYFKKNEKLIDRIILSSSLNKDLYGTKGRIKLSAFYCHDTKQYIRAYEEMGIHHVLSINSKNPTGVSNCLFNCGSKIRQNTAYSFLKHVKGHSRLHVMLHALVTKIIFDSHNNAVAVKVEQNGTEFTIKASREIILAAGVFKTPQLLMLSGIGPRRHLSTKSIKVIADLPVGLNLFDSPAVLSVFRMTERNQSSGQSTDPQWLGFPVLSSAIAIHHHDSFPDYTVKSFVLDDPHTFLTLCAITFTYSRSLCEYFYRQVVGSEIYLAFNQIAYPKSRGQVHLGSKSMYDQPVIHLGLYNNNKDLTSHAEYLKHFHRILKTNQFEKLGAELVNPRLKHCGRFDTSSLRYWRCYAQAMASTSHNNFGTCSMGSVVDANLSVKGVGRLRIVDASVIPTAISSPILAVVVMIAEKAADIIKKEVDRSRGQDDNLFNLLYLAPVQLSLT